MVRDEDRHHLERSLRVRPGDPLTVSDADGRWLACRYGDVLEPAGEVVTVDRPEPSLSIGVALVKGSRPELATQKLCELGIDRVMFFRAERSIVEWKADKWAKQLMRLNRIAREAAMQSRAVRLPKIDIYSDLASLLDHLPLHSVARADFDGDAPSLKMRTLLIGPEGGFSEPERATVTRAVSLGDQVLRAETAAIVGASLLVGLRNGLVEPRRNVS